MWLFEVITHNKEIKTGVRPMLETGLKTSISAVYFNSLLVLSKQWLPRKKQTQHLGWCCLSGAIRSICEIHSIYVAYDVFTVFEIPEAKSVTPMVQKLGDQKIQFIIKLKTRSMTRQCSSVWENPFQQSNVNVALVWRNGPGYACAVAMFAFLLPPLRLTAR